MVTHVFATIDEAAAVFAGRDIRNLPNKDYPEHISG